MDKPAYQSAEKTTPLGHLNSALEGSLDEKKMTQQLCKKRRLFKHGIDESTCLDLKVRVSFL
jgi:hypothetical protein